MAETTYTYDVAADFPDGKVNTGVLQTEIDGSSISTSLVRIDTEGGSLDASTLTGGTVKIVFADALSAGDKTTLDGDTTGPAGGLIADHDNTVVPSDMTVDTSNMEEEYGSSGRLQRRTYYYDVARSKKWQESLFTYQGNKLLSESVTQYHDNQTVHKAKTFNYSTETVGNVKKVRRELAS